MLCPSSWATVCEIGTEKLDQEGIPFATPREAAETGTGASMASQ